MFETITSRNNPRIKLVSKLFSSSRTRTENGLFAVEGLRLCLDAVRSGIAPCEVYFTQSFKDKHPDELQELTAASNSSFLTDEHIFDKISDTVSPQGVVCVLPMMKNQIQLKLGGKYVALCNVADPANLGAVSRTAEALGIDGMLVCGGCDMYNPKALRASMGALFRICAVSVSEDEMFELFRANNIKTFASTPRTTATPLKDCDFSSACAVLVGNEANGLSDEVIAKCDETVTIPMEGRAESLNASVAAAILMYEIKR